MKLIQTIVICLMSVLVTDGVRGQTGKEILKATGVQGGLIVHLGVGDGELTSELSLSPAYVVHGLDVDGAKVGAARKLIQAKGLYGRVSVQALRGDALPYTDNLINLVVAQDGGKVGRSEIMRVLAPNGVAYIERGGEWEKVIKQRPLDIDEWTHFLHGPDNNAVAKDEKVAPPKHIQWMGGPKFARAHEQTASFSVTVTSGGRMFYILDQSPQVDIRIDARWSLIARDAFNGVPLWERKMGSWVDQFRRFRSGPVNLQYRLVAAGDLVFVTLDFEGPVHVLDAATGKTLRIIEGSEKTKQITYQDGTLTLLIDDEVGNVDEIDQARRRGQFMQHNCRIKTVDAATGKTLWTHEVSELVFPCVALGDDRVYAQTPTRVMALDKATGEEVWNESFESDLPISAGKIKTGEMHWESPTLVVGDGVLFAADFKKVHAYSNVDGSILWKGDSANGYNAPADLFLIDNLVWMSTKGARAGLNPLTGEEVTKIPQYKGYMHPRCYRNKATENFLMLGDPGVQMINLKTGELSPNHWIRGVCQFGVMPANGLLYVPPDSCACNMKTKLNGIYALSGADFEISSAKEPGPGFVKGKAFGKVPAIVASIDDWPTYRGNAARNAITTNHVKADLKKAWTLKIGGKLTGVTVADGSAYVAAVDRHTVYAVNSKTGEKRWSFTAGGRIDSPPTYYQGAVYFGSADGWVYAVRASDGELVWQFRGAPEERLVSIHGQLESLWPIHGSVLVKDGVVSFAAGRSSYIDDGIQLYQLKAGTGDVIHNAQVYSPDAETGKQVIDEGKDVHGLIPDIMVADGDDIYMRHAKLDFETGDEEQTGTHLFSPLGLLDDTWWHRGYWVMSDYFQSHWSGWWKIGNVVPSGRIMTYNDDEIFGYGRNVYNGGNTGQWRGGEGYHLYAYDRPGVEKSMIPDPKAKRVKGAPKQTGAALDYRWSRRTPMLVTSMAVTDDAILIAGPPDVADADAAEGEEALTLKNSAAAVKAWTGNSGGIVWAVTKGDGEMMSEIKLDAPPRFDGMAVADGRVYFALMNGELVCMEGE